MDILTNMSIGVNAYRQVQQSHAGGKKRDLARDGAEAALEAQAGKPASESFKEMLQTQLDRRLANLDGQIHAAPKPADPTPRERVTHVRQKDLHVSQIA